jgi:hypothetical protein
MSLIPSACAFPELCRLFPILFRVESDIRSFKHPRGCLGSVLGRHFEIQTSCRGPLHSFLDLAAPYLSQHETFLAQSVNRACANPTAGWTTRSGEQPGLLLP